MTQNARQRAAVARAAASRILLRSGLPLLIGAACLGLLRDRREGLEFQAVAAVVEATSLGQWIAAAGATAVSFWAIGSYDLVMHRHLRTGVPSRVAQVSGAGSIALAQVLGMGMVTGALARWRMLSGAQPGMAAAVTGTVALSFMAAWALIAVLMAWLLPGVTVPGWIVLGTGGVTLAAVTLAFLCPVLRLGPLTLRLPSLRALAAMVLLTGLDIVAAAAALFVLMPADMALTFEVLLPVFALALGAGLFSSTPGGAGPFELTLLALLPHVAEAPLLGAVLAWRVIYYAVPAMIALIPLAVPFRIREAAPLPCPVSSGLLPQATRAECGVARQNGGRVLSTEQGTAVVAETGQTLTLLFDPISGRPGGVLSALSAAARDRMLIPVVYKCTGRLAARARRAGWAVLRIADDAVIDPAGFDTDGPQFRQLRRKLRQADKAGVQVTRERPAPAMLDELAEIDRQWVSDHRGARGFSMGRFCRDYLDPQQIFVARQEGRAIAFVTLHETRHDLALDLVRHAAQPPDGTMHLLIATAIRSAREEGRTRMTLAAMPARPGCEHRMLAALRHRIADGTGGAGLTRFKESFGPRRQPLYMAAPDMVTLALSAADIARTIWEKRC